MKSSKWVSMGLSALLVSAAPILADSRVIGTGDPARDVAAVQAAVNGGGTVTLMGLFNFGDDRMGYFYPGPVAETPANPLYPGYDPFHKGKSTVFITNSVSIQGAGAKIIGGRPAFWIGWDGDILEAAPTSGDYGRDWIPLAAGTDLYDANIFHNPDYSGLGKYRYFRVYRDIDVSIDGIESQNADTFFVMAGAGRRISYTNNRIYDCSPVDFMVWPAGAGIVSWNVALNAAGLLYPPAYYSQNLKTLADMVTKTEYMNCITESLLVKDNLIINQSGPGGGIASAWTNAVVTIEGNTVTNAAPDGVHLSDNPLSTYTVKNNTIGGVTNGINIFDTFFPVRANVLYNTVQGAEALRMKGTRDSIVRGNQLQSSGQPLIELLNNRNLVVEGNACLPGSTSNYGILLSGTSQSNILSNINLNWLTVTGTYVSCEAGTHDNTGTNILVPTCDRSRWLDDGGQDNSFEFIAIACLIDQLESYELPQGIANSLEAKLYRALDSLNRFSNGSLAGAIGALGAFINECQAQRDKKIPRGLADDLTAYARKIQTVLRAGLQSPGGGLRAGLVPASPTRGHCLYVWVSRGAMTMAGVLTFHGFFLTV